MLEKKKNNNNNKNYLFPDSLLIKIDSHLNDQQTHNSISDCLKDLSQSC